MRHACKQAWKTLVDYTLFCDLKYILFHRVHLHTNTNGVQGITCTNTGNICDRWTYDWNSCNLEKISIFSLFLIFHLFNCLRFFIFFLVFIRIIIKRNKIQFTFFDRKIFRLKLLRKISHKIVCFNIFLILFSFIIMNT